MMAGAVVVSRTLALIVAAFFSGYHVLLGVYSLDQPASATPIFAATNTYKTQPQWRVSSNQMDLAGLSPVLS